MLFDYIVKQRKSAGTLPARGVLIKTIVTTDLLAKIAKANGLDVITDLPVGFKYIANAMDTRLAGREFIFGTEESHGYLYGDYARDKDGAIGAVTAAEMISFLKDQGKLLTDYLNEIYLKFGYYRNVLYQVEVQGKEGFEDIVKFYTNLRANPPKEIAGLKVYKIIDRLDENLRKPENYVAGVTGDEITFILSEDEKVRLLTRPSGTQPQFKYYLQTFGKVSGNLEKVKKEVDSLAEKIEEDMYAIQDKILGKQIRGLKIRSHW